MIILLLSRKQSLITSLQYTLCIICHQDLLVTDLDISISGGEMRPRCSGWDACACETKV